MSIQYGELITTTQNFRAKQLADNVSVSRGLFMRLSEKGNIKATSGGVAIRQPLEYAENSATGWYSGFEQLSTQASDVLDSANYAWKQLYSAVTASGLEIDIQNTGKEQVIDLLDARISNSEKTMKNRLASGCYADGTGSGGKELGGLQLIVADTPTNTVGGISGNTYSWWRNIVFDATTDGGAAATSANIVSYMNRVYLQLQRGDDGIDFIAADNNYYRLYLESLQPNMRFSNSKLADAGFENIRYMNADVVLDGGKGGYCPTNHMYFLDTDYLFLRYATNRNMVSLKPRDSVNQDATVRFLAWAGAMTCSNRGQQGLLKD